MKTTFNSPIIGVPIEIHYSSQEEFGSYYYAQSGDTLEESSINGMTSTFVKGDKTKIVVWIKDDYDRSAYPLRTIAHESFHIVCKIRREMYALDSKENLIIGPQSEEDWAYMMGIITYKITDIISNGVQKEKRGLNAKKKEQTSTEDK